VEQRPKRGRRSFPTRIERLEEFDRYVAVAGFRGGGPRDVEALLRAVRGEEGARGVSVQLFDAGLIAGPEHLHFAALNALRASETGRNISHSLAVEALLYASAQRQIRKALELIGVRPESAGVAVLVIAETRRGASEALEAVSGLLGGRRDDGILELDDEKFEAIRSLFRISDLELQSRPREDGPERALTDLVIEHVALLATQR